MHRTVLITGASSGFGEACARRFAREGDRLILAARRADRLEALGAELSALVPVHRIPLDVRDRQAVFAAVADLPEPFAEVDILVNNAGLALGLDPAFKTDLDDWDCMVDTNVKGLMYCTRALLPGMVARNRGHIVNIGSIAGSWPYPGGNTYGATKAFVQRFSQNLRCDLLGTRIRVTCIEPGFAETEFGIVRFKGDTERAHKMYENMSPLRGDDIAEAVAWAASVPPHVNVNTLELMPLNQAWAGFAVHRDAAP